jgi:AAA15 family ATPase/GTPase
MKVSKVTLSNIRGYENSEIELSPKINLVIGENNSGKTTILKSLLLLQDLSAINSSDVRSNVHQGAVSLVLSDIKATSNFVAPFNTFNSPIESILYSFTKVESLIAVKTRVSNEPLTLQNFVSAEEPNNFIYPFLSRRKVSQFNENIGEQSANAVSGNLSNVFAKVDRISTDGLPAKDRYSKACSEILGFHISSFPSAVNGKKAVYIIDDFQNIPLESMGEGVSNILGLILDLCVAKDKLFLIEEPENDIHPKALKKLLNLIIEKSDTNQFVITTHSNIVLKHLGSSDSSKIFKVDMEFEDRIPTSYVSEIENTPEARREVLEDLGYELFDFDIWDTWLILEESSAEAIIREFLIPDFVPGLKYVLKTCAAGSVSKVSARIEALHSLCLFLHLQKSFNDRIWVVVDGGETEKKITDDLKNKYKSWKEDRIIQFAEHDFEKYYPQQFQEQVSNILTKSGDDKRKAKKELLDEVKKWYGENPDLAREEFEKSALEVINILKGIETARCDMG